MLARKRCRLGLDERAEIGIFGDPGVAPQHAEIEETPGGFVWHQLDAQKPSRLNGKQVAAATAQPLRDGDRIELGRTVLVFRHR